MRGAVILLIGGMLAIPAARAEDDFPYKAEISVDVVEVRCGPDWEYYPTSRLERGDQVEVYRHEPGGWLAIRPPKGSHSWIPARQVQRGDQPRVGKVRVDAAVAWVGSAVREVRQHKWQVRLEKNEQIEILGEASLSVGTGFATETHYKIAPPAGEFRWIHAEHAAAPKAKTHRAASRTLELVDVTHSSGGSTVPPPTDTAPSVPSTSAASSSQPVAPRNQRDLDALERKIDQLQLDLSLLVSQEVARWDLGSLRARGEQLTQQARGTSLSRSVRLLMHRIDQFETLRDKHRRMAESPAGSPIDEARLQHHSVSPAGRDAGESRPLDKRVKPTGWQEDIAASLDQTAVIGTGIDRLAAEMSAGKPGFDAEGWLMPVHSTRRVAPPFALLDADGRVVCYVQPSPGLNLRRYTKRRVGLFGEARRIPDLKATLLTVTRVVKQP